MLAGGQPVPPGHGGQLYVHSAPDQGRGTGDGGGARGLLPLVPPPPCLPALSSPYALPVLSPIKLDAPLARRNLDAALLQTRTQGLRCLVPRRRRGHWVQGSMVWWCLSKAQWPPERRCTAGCVLKQIHAHAGADCDCGVGGSGGVLHRVFHVCPDQVCAAWSC